MRKIAAIFAFLSLGLALKAQEIRVGNIVVDTTAVRVSEIEIDPVTFKKKTQINDYTLIGVHYAVGMNQMIWNPAMRQGTVWTPVNFGITWTRYGKLIIYPNVGIQAGIFYVQEGYRLTGGYNVSDATKAVMDLVEVPVLAHGHFDFWKMKLMVNIGFYAAYRLKIHRTVDPGEPALPEYIVDHFLPTDNRFDYGIKGGLGFGFIFDPVEIHFTAMYKYGLGNLYQPDYKSSYYYNYASVSNFVFSVSLHFQVTKRIGKTTAQLKREARELLKEQSQQPMQ